MIDCVEIFKDDMTNEVCSSETTGLDAREYSLRMMGIKSPIIIKVLSGTIYFNQIAISLLSVFIACFKLLKAVVFYKDGNRVEKSEGSTLFLAFTPLFLSRIEKTDLKEGRKPITWIVGPNVKDKIALPKDANVIRWENYQQKKDLWGAFVDVIKICCVYPFSTKMIFPVYRYWDFCLVARSLERITPDNDLFFSNQSDRWALLFDRLPAKSKTLLQHGIDLDYGGKLVKLRNITHFYAISKGTWQNTYKYLLDCEPELHIMKPSIELSEVDTDKVSVLIISHIIYFETEKRIIEALKGLSIQVYVKKHPTVIDDTVYRDLQEKYGFIYITDSSFPKVDYVISYESTLAYEYMTFDVPVYIYPTNNDVSISEIKKSVKELTDK